MRKSRSKTCKVPRASLYWVKLNLRNTVEHINTKAPQRESSAFLLGYALQTLRSVLTEVEKWEN